jgi:hypothetical protein
MSSLYFFKKKSAYRRLFSIILGCEIQADDPLSMVSVRIIIGDKRSENDLDSGEIKECAWIN